MTQMQIMDRKLELITAYLLAKDAGSRKRAEETLKEFLENLPFQGEARRAKTRNETIRDVLVELGAGEHLDGYEYLVEAIEAKLDGKRRHIYAGVARKHEITESRVERACRGVVSWIFRVAGPKVFELEGESFASQNLVRIEPKKDFPEKLTLTGLDSVCRLIRNEANDLFQADQILVQVESYNTVKVFTTLDGEMDRCWLYQCRADTPEAKTNRWLDHEEAVIQLQSMYIPNSDTAYLLQLLSSVSKDSKVTTLDNGVTQSVEARTGVALRGSVPVKPRVKLMPFRTFLEVAQPESEFILRLDSNGQINLIGADGGAWKLEAVRSIAAYFDEQLGDLVEAGRVVVLR